MEFSKSRILLLPAFKAKNFTRHQGLQERCISQNPQMLFREDGIDFEYKPLVEKHLMRTPNRGPLNRGQLKLGPLKLAASPLD